MAPVAVPVLARFALRAVAAVALACGLGAQEGADPELDTRRAAAVAIAQWIGDFERDLLGPRGDLRKEAGLRPRYSATALAAGLLSPRDPGVLTHFDALQKILFWAEGHPDEAIGAAMLGVAGAGIEKSLADLDALTVRELGHVTLLRVAHPGVWAAILRTATGAPAEDGGEAPPVARRVAALKLLGPKGDADGLAAIEQAAADPDPRVRLAAVEALQGRSQPDVLPLLLRSCGAERHPVVAAALVRALLSTLKTGRDTLPRADLDAAVAVALGRLGQCGWRTDMDLVELCAEFPQKAAIPQLIELLAPRQSADERLVDAVNKNASPLLRDRAWTCLRGMTGAIFAVDQYAAWRAFWQQEQERIAVPVRVPLERDLNGTRSAFFGIPVRGRQIAFVIDTSGSMDEPVGTTAGSARPGAATRLSLAKEQLLLAVQAMDPEARYTLLTFDVEAKVWSPKPVAPNAQSLRALTELLSHLKTHGGTNLYDGIAQALSLSSLRYGQEAEAPVDEVFVLSDGEPTAGPVRDPAEILRLVRAANVYLKARIHAVFVGAGGGAAFLRQLADENGGVFVQR